MKPECAAGAAVWVSPITHSPELGSCGVGSIKPQLDHASAGRRHIWSRQRLLQRGLADVSNFAAVRTQPFFYLRLIDAPERALRDFLQLSVDRALRCLRNTDCRVEQLAVDENAAIVNHGVEHPKRLLLGAQGSDW